MVHANAIPFARTLSHPEASHGPEPPWDLRFRIFFAHLRRYATRLAEADA